MSSVEQESHAVAESRGSEVIVQRIAGPITAAELGVPVGTVVEARHAIREAGSTESVGRVISPDEARALGGYTDAQIRDELGLGEEE